MAGVGALISSLISSVTNLLPKVKYSFFAPSSSSNPQSPNASVVEEDLNALMRTLKRIKATIHDAEEREIRDSSVKLWLKELKEVGRSAEYVIDEYMYEVYRAQVEARNTSALNPHNRTCDEGSVDASSILSIMVPDGFVDRIRGIRNRFDEIAKDREALQLREEDGLRRDESVRPRAPSSHIILESNVFGRENDKKEVIELLFSNINEGVITVVPIVGKGGIGKTTLAQLVYNDEQVKQKFDIFGWICVSEDFNIERLFQEIIESFTRNNCSIKNMGILQEKIMEIVAGKRIFVVLDDVWNEDNNLWELFRALFISALKAFFILTTRSDRVAKIMQTTPPFRLGCLSNEESWSLFKHYAFGCINHNLHPNLLNIGKQITQKCGGLPLAVKSISNLLRYEDEQSWVEILENNLWEMYGENDIFGALQISYARMPAYLRPCFLYCSLFPKDYMYNVDEVVELWIAQGYIESKGRKTLEEIAFEYAVELIERSFFDRNDISSFLEPSRIGFKLHDLIHDLAQLNSDNEFYYIENGQQPNPPEAALHVNTEGFNGILDHLNFDVTRLRTLLLRSPRFCIDFLEAKHLRFLKVNCRFMYPPSSIFSLYHLEKLTLMLEKAEVQLQTLGNLTNLKFLSLSRCFASTIPDSFCLLSNLRMIKLEKCSLVLLPKNIGNLVHLQKLEIRCCDRLCFLPESLCKISGLKTLILTECLSFTALPNNIGNLTNLQNLTIRETKINYLPESLCAISRLKTLILTNCLSFTMLPNNIGNLTNLQNLTISGTQINYLPCSFNNINVIIPELHVQISLKWDGISDRTSWLKDFDYLKGTLAISHLSHMPSVKDACNFNLVSKPYLEKLIFSWDTNLITYIWDTIHVLYIKIETNLDYMVKRRITGELLGKNMDLRVLENLQPHPNLKHLQVHHYGNPMFPRWMGDPLCCASLEELHLYDTCIEYLPFGNLRSVKHLTIKECVYLRTISRESLPSQLQSLIIEGCISLLSIMGLEDLESLVELEIHWCYELQSFPFVLISEDRCHISSSSRLNNLTPFKKLNMSNCPKLRLAVNEMVPSVHSNIDVRECEGLKEWCLQHNISYK